MRISAESKHLLALPMRVLFLRRCKFDKQNIKKLHTRGRFEWAVVNKIAPPLR